MRFLIGCIGHTHDLFFQGFAVPESDRKPEVNRRLGKIRYLNGGLFLKHSLEQKYAEIQIPNEAFDLFGLFRQYSWSLDDTPGGKDDEVNPAVLGYIFEKYINQKASNNQKAFGAYYTRTEITQYLCEKTIHRLILDKVNEPDIPGYHTGRKFESIAELLLNLDSSLCKHLLDEVLPNLRILDPACGSGAFLVAAMKTLIDIYAAILGKITFLHDAYLSRKLADIGQNHKNVGYYIKKRIITDNLFGVDLMEEATEIAKLRLFLALVSSAENESQLEPLPNIDFNILCGNSLLGLIHVDYEQLDERRKQGNLFFKSFRELLAEKNRAIDLYRRTAGVFDDLSEMRDSIQRMKAEANGSLNELLVDEFLHLEIKYRQATWDSQANKEGKPKKRNVTLADVKDQRPFHWGYEFDEILNQSGGFDAIITNPPWEVFQTDEKEFFQNYVPTIQKKKLRIEDWDKQHTKLMKDATLRKAWLEYVSRFPHMSAYFKSAAQYRNQQSRDSDGDKIASKINLFKLFTEQCFNLLRKGGQCGIVIPSSIYTDLGAKQLRQMLFSQTQITGLFCFENRRQIFEGVDSRFKFVVLTFEKGGTTESFPAPFMRYDVDELTRFPHEGAFQISIELVKRLSPNSFSINEFVSALDFAICERILPIAQLGDQLSGTWNLRLTQDLNMNSDSDLFRTSRSPRRLPLYEGKMIWQFSHVHAQPKYWIDEHDGRERIIGNTEDTGQTLGYQQYRLGFREISASTNERTMVCTILPKQVFANHKILLYNPISPLTPKEQAFCCAVLNSFTFDYLVRQRGMLSMFMFYQLPMKRLTEADSGFQEFVKRSAQLTCTAEGFDDFAKACGIGSHKSGVSDPNDRAKLRAELDGLVAHLYGLTEEEFAYILTTFPLVEQSVKDAALQAYRDLAPKSADEAVSALIKQNESLTLEFKSSARWDYATSQKSREVEFSIQRAVAALLNTKGGDLIIGVNDQKTVLGVEPDYKLLQKHDRDGYELFLSDLIFRSLGTDLVTCVKFTVHCVDGKDIWRISCTPSPHPVYLKDIKNVEQLFVRRGNSTVALTPKEAVEYARTRWTD